MADWHEHNFPELEDPFLKDKLWMTNDGRCIPFKDLSDDHLENIIAWLKNDDWKEAMLQEKRRRIIMETPHLNALLLRMNELCRIINSNENEVIKAMRLRNLIKAQDSIFLADRELTQLKNELEKKDV
jgi:hypothetical protein